MALTPHELIPTRATLISRLKDWRDESSWQDFFNTYWRLIYGIAIQGGLTPEELYAWAVALVEQLKKERY